MINEKFKKIIKSTFAQMASEKSPSIERQSRFPVNRNLVLLRSYTCI